jgi:hypothetical protein
MMYSFAQRQDCQVYDEPLYGYYLQNTSASAYHPDADLVLQLMETDGTKVVEFMLGDHPKPVVFFKNITHHLLDLDRSFTREGFNILLTREPMEMLPSFDKVVPNPSLFDVGYAAHVDMVQYFLQHDIPFVVMDSKNILLDPAGQLTSLCKRAGISFDPSMLSWKKGARPEDGVWAKHWYKSLHQSTGFKAYAPKEDKFPTHLEPLLEVCTPYYETLRKYFL